MSLPVVLFLVGLVAGGPCDGPSADPWVGAFRDRVIAYDGLAAFAAATHGEPVGCEGEATTEFDGVRFGALTLTFAGGVAFDVETMPPESSVATLRSDEGFADDDAVRAALQEYADGKGLDIDWTAPDETTEGSDVVRTFHDRDASLNASASLVYRAEKLVAVGVALAL